MTAEETATSNQSMCVHPAGNSIVSESTIRAQVDVVLELETELLGCGPLLDATVNIRSCSPFIALAPKSGQKSKNMPSHHLDGPSALKFLL
jgi:hypothetical protein